MLGPDKSRAGGKPSHLSAAIHSTTGTSLTLLPSHAVRFSSTSGCRDVVTEDHELINSMLNNAIDAVSVTKEFIGINVVKGALAGVGAVLIIVRVCIFSRIRLWLSLYYLAC